MSDVSETIFDALEQAWSARDVGRLVGLFTPDCIYEDMALGARHEGHDGVREFAEGVFATMPDFDLRFPVRLVSSGRGASSWIIKAHWNGLFEGIDRTGHPIVFSGLSSYVFRDGRIALNIDCWDYCAVARSFGVLPQSLVGLPAA